MNPILKNIAYGLLILLPLLLIGPVCLTVGLGWAGVRVPWAQNMPTWNHSPRPVQPSPVATNQPRAKANPPRKAERVDPFAGQPLKPTPGAYRTTWGQVFGPNAKSRIFRWTNGEIRNDDREIPQNYVVLVDATANSRWAWDLEGKPTMPTPGR